MKQPLTLNEYQKWAGRTDSQKDDREAMLNFALGIAGEAGEIVDLVKKVVYHGHEIDKAKFTAELGDQLWYIARMADRLGITLETVANFNIGKLYRRYPEGFDKERSINRDE